MPLNTWNNPAGPLNQLAETLGFDIAKLKLNEWPDELNYSDEHFPADQLILPGDQGDRNKKLDALDRVFNKLVEKYGSAISFQLDLGPVYLKVDSTYNKSLLDAFCNDIAGSPVVEFHLKIKKKELAALWGFNHPRAIFKVFLFPEALIRALAAPLTELENGDDALMKRLTGEQKLLILAPDHEIALNGDYLAVLGGNTISRWAEYLPATRPGDARDKVSFVHSNATAQPKWSNISLNHLTPLHLSVDWTTPQHETGNPPHRDDGIARNLYAQLLACTLLYLASHSRGKEPEDANDAAAPGEADHSWIATFAADKYLARVEVGDTNTIAETMIAVGGDTPWDLAKIIGELAQWTYKEIRGVANRLNVLQAVVARSLQDKRPSDNLQEIIRRAPDIFERVQRRWDAFIDEKLDKYFSHIKELEQTVETTTKTYNEQVNTITKALTENMLGAVAVVVGSFLAAIFKSPFETYIFRFGTGIYIVYLIIFPIAIGLLSAWQNFRDSRDAFEKAKRKFINLLSQPEVEQIVGDTVRSSGQRFARWFAGTISIYAAVVVLLILATLTLPARIGRWADNFHVASVVYSQPPSSEVVHLTIRGEDFDKDKEIVVTIGSFEYSNVDEQILKVHGSTVLAFSPKQEDLAAAKEGGATSAAVRQGSASSQTISLPHGPAPIPRPAFDRWNLGTTRTNKIIEAYGKNFGSISSIVFNGAKLNLKVLEGGQKLELSNDDALKTMATGKSIEIILKNGEKLQEIVSAAAAPVLRGRRGETRRRVSSNNHRKFIADPLSRFVQIYSRLAPCESLCGLRSRLTPRPLARISGPAAETD